MWTTNHSLKPIYNQSRVFISVSLFQEFEFLYHCSIVILRLILYYPVCVCVHMFFRCFQLLLVGGSTCYNSWGRPDVRSPRWVGRAVSASMKYCSSYCRWKYWASRRRLRIFPVSPFHLSLYLRFLSAAKTDFPSEVCYSQSRLVASYYRRTLSPTDHPLVKEVLAGAKRLLAH